MNIYNKVTGKKVGHCEKKGVSFNLFDLKGNKINPEVDSKTGKVYTWTVDSMQKWGNSK